MNQELEFSIITKCIICTVFWITGGWLFLLLAVGLCALIGACELSFHRKNTNNIEKVQCELCGSTFLVLDKSHAYEYKITHLCPNCLDAMFKYHKSEPEEAYKLIAEEPVE
ncbi:MAG: hypothetical protein ABFC34_13500 [Methanobacterium sp.]